MVDPCGQRTTHADSETVDESGEQPEEQPNRLETVTGSKRPRALPKRQRRRNGEGRNGSKGELKKKKATLCTLSSTSQPQRQQLQQPPSPAAAATAGATMRLQQWNASGWQQLRTWCLRWSSLLVSKSTRVACRETLGNSWVHRRPLLLGALPVSS